MTSQEVIRLLSILTLASNVGVVLFVALFLLRKMPFFTNYWNKTLKFFTSKALLFSFTVALTSMSGSLYLSEVAHFTPCVMCWYQRIFMYPLVIILGTALWKKRRDVWQFVLPLSLIGLVLAVYHYNLQLNPNQLAPCTTVGFSVSCSERFTTTFGYITIPFMSVSAFVLITIGMFLVRIGKKGN